LILIGCCSFAKNEIDELKAFNNSFLGLVEMLMDFDLAAAHLQ